MEDGGFSYAGVEMLEHWVEWGRKEGTQGMYEKIRLIYLFE